MGSSRPFKFEVAKRHSEGALSSLFDATVATVIASKRTIGVYRDFFIYPHLLGPEIIRFRKNYNLPEMDARVNELPQ